MTLANPGLTKAILLDINGMPTDTPVEVKRAAGKATAVLPANSLYVILVAERPLCCSVNSVTGTS